MSTQETGPLEPQRMTAPLDESSVTPREIILNSVIDTYLGQREQQGENVTVPPNLEDVNWILAKYCDEHEGLSDDDKNKIRKTIETILPIRIARNNPERSE